VTSPSADLPLITCPECTGTGKLADLWASPCARCRGKGKIPDLKHATTSSPTFFTIPARTSRSTCRSCAAMIFFIRNGSSWMPISTAIRDAVEPGQAKDGRGISHFVDCPEADKHRRAK
jgi:hypothetical protein